MSLRHLLIATSLATGFGVAPVAATEPPQPTSTRSTLEKLDLFGDVFERIRRTYVEEVDDTALIEAAIQGMLSSLDPHSAYLPPADSDDMKVQTRGEFGGLGIEVTMEQGLVKVVSPIDGSPASAAGVLAGDMISEIEGDAVMGMTLGEAVDRMRGPKGEAIRITVIRENVEDPIEFEIVRDVIRIQAVKARAEGQIGVLRISGFNGHTTDMLKEKIAELDEEIGVDRVKGYVLDLRNNPGGLLDQAIKVADAFLEEGGIVSTRGRDGEIDRSDATPGDITRGLPLVVLINQGSASASEIVAGALQDNQRAIVIGGRSFGKGSVQTIMSLDSSSAMRITTARYYTPSGRSIQGLGIEPDILVERQKIDAPKDEGAARPARSEARLRGSLGSALSEEDKAALDASRARHEAAQALRAEDLPLAYGLDMIEAMSILR